MRFFHFDKGSVLALLRDLAKKIKVQPSELDLSKVDGHYLLSHGDSAFRVYGIGRTLQEAIFHFYLRWIQRNN